MIDETMQLPEEGASRRFEVKQGRLTPHLCGCHMQESVQAPFQHAPQAIEAGEVGHIRQTRLIGGVGLVPADHSHLQAGGNFRPRRYRARIGLVIVRELVRPGVEPFDETLVPNKEFLSSSSRRPRTGGGPGINGPATLSRVSRLGVPVHVFGDHFVRNVGDYRHFDALPFPVRRELSVCRQLHLIVVIVIDKTS